MSRNTNGFKQEHIENKWKVPKHLMGQKKEVRGWDTFVSMLFMFIWSSSKIKITKTIEYVKL